MSESSNPIASPSEEPKIPGTQWIADASPSLHQTTSGLSVLYYGLVIVLLCLIVNFAIALEWGPLILGRIAALGMCVGGILIFLGPFLCLRVPPESKSRGYIMGSVGLQLASLFVLVLLTLRGFAAAWAGQHHDYQAVVVLACLLGLAVLVSFILFVLFIRRLAQFIGRRDLADRARNVLIALAAGILLVLVMASLPLLRLREGARAAVIVAVPTVLGVLVGYIMYASLVNRLRKALKK